MCTTYIYRHIMRLPRMKLFTTRELLQYGRRSAVDQALYRMVKAKFIIRLARGVFVRDDSRNPSLFEIATVKAAAFGKKLLKHAVSKLVELKLVPRTETVISLFAISGHSSSFLTCHGRVTLHGIGARKAKLCQTEVGQVVNALWHLGESGCTAREVTIASRNFQRTKREQFRQASALMPAWLHNICRFRYPSARVI